MTNSEEGRSMVEMLGVLAIIGVLSVAGIAGYSMAMKKLKANNILDLASKAHIAAMAGNFGAGARYEKTDIDELCGSIDDVDLCTTSAGNVKYNIKDDKVADVVAANKPSWLCPMNDDTSCNNECP